MLNACLFGAAPSSTGNLGLSALCDSTLEGIFRRCPEARITVFDFRADGPEGKLNVDGQERRYRLLVGTHSRRYYRRDCFWNMRVSGWLGGLGNPALKALRDASIVLDLSSGDGFTDELSKHRFWIVTFPKLLALEQGRPLILMPQTYGPFLSPRRRRLAERIVRRARQAWARDARSFEVLLELLGSDLDPQRHRLGVDVAFGLQARAPGAKLGDRVAGWLAASDTPRIGLNVSGLMYLNPELMLRNFRHQASYRRVIDGLLSRIISATDARVLLVPHVLVPPGNYESDPQACAEVVAGLGPAARERVEVLPPTLDAAETKWVISRLDWFCGSRMHSTIAGLSSGVPTAAVSYSSKFEGVFECCGQEQHIVDPRELDEPTMADRLFESWRRRDDARTVLRERLPAVLRQAEEQMDEVVRASLECA